LSNEDEVGKFQSIRFYLGLQKPATVHLLGFIFASQGCQQKE
jgi:hypothetical protein